ncbi:hypothetical protein HMPREF1982_00397 [Clostridiales bacterium oral taxon 876 str. F0540]|nr:hypothetical protein HMPREF1982_00397 [Clostridiales bacterium oral taxon 876 str. F0540]
MFNTKDELLENMNLRIYEIKIDRVMDLLKKYREDKKLLDELMTTSFKIDIDFSNDKWRSEIKKKLEIKDISKKSLQDRFNSTGNPVFNILNRYVTAEKKAKDFENLYEQLNLHKGLESELTIKRRFAFNVNNAGNIQPSSPTFSGLSKEEMLQVTGFWEAIEFSTTEEQLSYLNKYSNCLREGYSSNFLIKGTVLYITIYTSEQQ